MTLEDFFTLTEMKDGLTAPARVKELINVLQNDKHNTLKNVSDSTRQWSTVASTIASTENKECLALFLKLDGLCYFDTWLKHGQKCFQEPGDSFIEEAIIVLLGAIEKLYREDQKSVISGIMMTVKELLSNNSSRVQDMARVLSDSWKQNNEVDVVQKDVDKDVAVFDDAVDVNENPLVADEVTPAICPETMETEVVANLTIRPSDNKSLDHASPDPIHSCTSKLLSENSSVLENPSKHQSEATTGVGSSGSAFSEPRMIDGQLDVDLIEHDEATQMLQISSFKNLGSTGTFCGNSVNTVESILAADNDKAVDVETLDPCLKSKSPGDVRKEVFEGIDEMHDSLSPNPCSKLSASDSTSLDVLQGSSLSELNMEKNEGVTSNLSRKEDTDAIEESNSQNVSNEAEVVRGDVDLSANSSRKEDTEAIEEIELSNGQNVSDKDDVNWGNKDLTTNLSRKQSAEAIEEPDNQNNSDGDEVVRVNDPEFYMSNADPKHSLKKKSGFQLDYDMFDPLEVARQVAIEVEREMDCREPSCSSSETSGGGIRLSESPDSLNEKKSRATLRPCKDVSAGPNLSAFVGDKVFVEAKNLPSERENHIVDIEPTGVSEVAQKLKPDEGKDVRGFDLNKDVLSDDDTDKQTKPVIAPISLVSASRVAATSGLPVSPLQFDGTHEWKGSAESSAFHAAPAHKVSVGENSIFASGSSSSLALRQEYLDFDLNVAESEDYKISDLPPSRETPNPTAWISGEYSLESCPKRSDLLQLDLNCVSDSGDAPLSYWRKEERVLPPCNGQFSPSASSASSSMQPLKNIDLNDQPSAFTEFLHPALTAKSSPSLYTSGLGGIKTNKSVISLMGARVEVSHEDNVPQTIPLLSGRIVDPALVASMTKNDSVLGFAPSSLYAHSYMHGYYGSPSRPTLPFSSAIFGPSGQIPFMVDSRGTPVVPQVSGPVPAIPSPFVQQSSFFQSLAAPHGDFNHSRGTHVVPQVSGPVPAIPSPFPQQSSFFQRLAAPPGDFNDSRGTPVVPQVSGPVPAIPSPFPQQSSFFQSLAAPPGDFNDSRVTPVVPQVSGPVPAINSPFPQQSSFFQCLAAPPGDFNGFVPSRLGFDLNSGLMYEGRSRDAGNIRQLFNSGQGISINEHMRANSQSTSGSGVGGKRKEIEGGWEPYSFNYKDKRG